MDDVDHNSKEKRINKTPEAWWQPAVMTFARLSGWIVAPVLIGTFLGRWLDNKNDTEPWLFIITVGTAFIVSIIGLGYNVLKEYKRIEEESAKRFGKIENSKNYKN